MKIWTDLTTHAVLLLAWSSTIQAEDQTEHYLDITTVFQHNLPTFQGLFNDPSLILDRKYIWGDNTGH